MAGGIAVSPTLLSNAVQYSRGRKGAVIEGDRMTIDGEAAIYARDNGAGFDARYAARYAASFSIQRLHTLRNNLKASESGWRRFNA